MTLRRAAARLAAASAAAAAVALAVLPLATCSNPVDLVEAVTVEVMKGNDRYVEVEYFSPGEDAVDTDPNGSILVRFDRAVDLASVTTSSVKILQGTSEIPWVDPPEVENEGLALRFWPVSFLNNNTTYSVTIAGLRSTTGDYMHDSRSWSFMTGEAPAGTISIQSNNTEAKATYTNSNINTVSLTTNGASSDSYYITTTDISAWNADEFALIDSGSWVGISNSATLPAYDIGTATGYRTVYVVFRHVGPTKYSSVKRASITYDTSRPTVSVNIDSGATYSLDTSLSTAFTISDTAAATFRYSTSTDNSTWSSWIDMAGTSKTVALSVAAGDAVTRQVWTRAMDAAGNVSLSPGTDTIIVDTVKPSAPSVGQPTTPTTDTTPTWTWTGGGGGNGQYQYYESWIGTWKDISSTTYTPVAVADGYKTLYVRERDAAGNWSDYSYTTVGVDTTPPTVSLSVGYLNPASTNSSAVTLYISASDAISGVYQSHYGNYGQAYSAWEAYATTKAWTLEDKAGTRRVYIQVKDNLGNTTAQLFDEIVLNARLLVTYNQLYISNDGDAAVLGIQQDGEIYYYFYVDGVQKLYRPEASYLSIEDPYTITSGMPAGYLVYEDPTSGSFSMTGTVYDDDSPLADDYGTMAAITYSAPFASVASASRAISGDVAGAIYYSVAFQNP